MKYPPKYDGIVHNNLAEIMAEKEMKIHRLANKTGFSRALLSNLYNNPAQNTTIKTAYHIADSLEVPISRLFEKKTSFSQFNSCDPNGFSKENLEILTTEIKKSGISPIYQVYNRDRNTNIYTAHAGNRRLSFRGNLRFIYWDIPELVIINLDISIRRIDVYDDETKSLHYN